MIRRLSPTYSRRASTLATCFAIAAVMTISGCQSVNAYYDPAKPHHTPTGFRNNDADGQIEGNGFWRWKWEQLKEGLPKPPANGYQMTIDSPDTKALQNNGSDNTATWIGHATVLIQMGGKNLLTDPMFSERASPLTWTGPQRKTPPAMQLDALPRIDIVLISHNHYDHLDIASVKALNAQAGGPPLFLVPLGIKPWMADLGITNVRELDWWDSVKESGLALTFVPAQHWSARGLTDRSETLWGGWVAQTDTSARKPFSVYFAGDTGYSSDFVNIAKRFSAFDLALLPIGAYEPRWFMRRQHVNPEEAVRIHRDVKAKQSIGIHWGTFELTNESLDEPPLALRRAMEAAGLPVDQFIAVTPGKTLRY